MTRSYSAINLPNLPAPQVITPISPENELQGLLRLFKTYFPDYDEIRESDPAYKLCEAFAYRLAVEKQRRNEAFKAVMLAYATDGDLDQLGANVNVERLVVSAADPTTIPPTPQIMERDDDFRMRIQLSPERLSTAGSIGSYEYWVKSASGQVADVQVTSPDPGDVVLYIMARDGDGTAPAELLDAVLRVVNAEDVRPLTDHVTVQSAVIVPYSITATLEVYPGPDSAVVLASAQAALAAYVESVHRIGYLVATSGIYAALQQPGVRNVVLQNWQGDLVMADGQVAYCTFRTVNIEVAGHG